jgi:Putative zinc-finger
MVIKCEDVWREISDYLEGDLDPALKRAMEEHFEECRHCVAVRNGIRNVVMLYGDKQMFTLPADFYPRLHRRLGDEIKGQKGSSLGWLVSLAAAGALAALGLFTAAQNRSAPQPRAAMSQPARERPQALVAIVDEGKVFHRPGCPYMHGKYRMVTAEEAIREGYTPCNRCMSDALHSAENLDALDGEKIASVATPQK